MIKYKFNIIIFILVTITLSSCKDVLDSDKNIITASKDDPQGLSKILEYHFLADFKIYRNDDTTNTWSALIPYPWTKTFNLVNVSSDSIVNITDVTLLSGEFFSVYSLNSLPIKLYPNQINSNDQFSIMLRTTNLKPDTYIDKIIINRNKNIGFFVKVTVN